ncbi:MAG: UDP-3-O-(3-hydroxymyristoyl)glucosamine N-acyltransferase [Phycisphaerales bacterium]|nr:UDP-3-O-(3-hydroxymyristoyl)glucosamine N-acyltransferase [Phycisphaerales bacterium]
MSSTPEQIDGSHAADDQHARRRCRSITVSAIAAQTAGAVHGREDLTLTGLNTLDDASDGDLTFIGDPKHAVKWADSKAAAAFVTEGITVPGHDPTERSLIVVPNADLAMATALALFAPPTPAPAVGVHATAIIDPTARIGPGARIGPHVVVGEHTTIGDHVTLHPGVVIGDDVRMGNDCVLWPNVVVRERSRIGDRVILHVGSVIGCDGFGHRLAADGQSIQPIPHVGWVELHDDVEIGANTTVDRGKFGPTVIGSQTKIDNLVQVGHNCRIGRGCLLAGQVGLAGSVTLGDGVIMGGNVGIRDHVTIGDRAQIAAKSGVMDNIPASEVWSGYPARPHGETMRQEVVLRKMVAKRRDRTTHAPESST